MVTDLDREKIAAANYQDGFDEGVKTGELRGIEKEKIDTARRMLDMALDDSIIEKATGLTEPQISELKRDYSKSCR